jgi:hypothetical protein
MRTVSVGLSNHLAGEVTTIARCLRITQANGTVNAYTDHDEPIVYGGITYSPITVGTPTEVASSAALNVDTVDVSGINDSAGITDDELRAGLWDYAGFQLFVVNYNDLSQGAMILRTGRLGEVTMDRGQFKTELRGLTQAYSRTIGEIVSPSCRAVLGDSRCGVAMGPYTVTGTIDSVAADGVTLFDAERTEAGPDGGLSMVFVQGNPTLCTTSGSPGEHLDLPNGSPIVISGATGQYAVLNIVTTLSGYVRGNDYDEFDLLIDSSTFSGGQGSPVVTPLGSTSGYFDYGVMTMTSGANDGLSMEVKSYTVGQIVLQLPFPYAVAVGDSYSLTAGCDRSFTTCKDRFSNVLNFRGEPYVPGLDKVIQVGRQG